MEESKISYDEIMAMFKEIGIKFQESIKENDKRFKETDRKFQETIKENDKRFKETDKKFNQLHGLFTSQWGKLIEAILTLACLNLFIKRGINVVETHKNHIIKRNGIKQAEYDVILSNGSEIVVVEIKTTLKVKQVDHFITQLSRVKELIPAYSEKTVYGAVAAISFDENTDDYATNNGLFVIKSNGEGIVFIDNNEKFKPKAF